VVIASIAKRPCIIFAPPVNIFLCGAKVCRPDAVKKEEIPMVVLALPLTRRGLFFAEIRNSGYGIPWQVADRRSAFDFDQERIGVRCA
jgi:hypothetical protein